VQPDLAVVCDAQKLDERGCRGAPDWIIEILSPATARLDQIKKLALYEKHGVREYWLVHPLDGVVYVYSQTPPQGYGRPAIHEAVGTQAVGLFPDLAIDWGLIFPGLKPDTEASATDETA
jgi:Uma2 family endonuclease